MQLAMTHNRRMVLLDAVSHSKKTTSRTTSLPELLPALEKKVRELEQFPQSSLRNDEKIGFFRQLANGDLCTVPESLVLQAVKPMKHSVCTQSHESRHSVRPRATTM